MLNTPFEPWPSFSQAEAELVTEVLLSNKVNYWTGEECRQFEQEFADFCQVDYAIGLANGTLALELALRAIGIGPGDEVIVPPRTFIASASTVVNVGAIPVFADVDLDSQVLTRDTIAEKITANTKAIICVHLAGWPCDMRAIMDLAARHGLKVIEDCAQAHGATIEGRPVGAWGDIGAWSFCQDKIMTTGGEGGMVTTNSKAYWEFMWSYKDHGKSWTACYEEQHPPGFRWLHHTIGSNFRMMEIQAVIGRHQLIQLPKWLEQRRNNATKILTTAADFTCFTVPHIPDKIEHAFYKLYLYVDSSKLAQGWSRDRILNTFIEQGVPVYTGSCSEVYLEDAFKSTDLVPTERLENARMLAKISLMFLVHPTLSAENIAYTCELIRQIGSKASRVD